MQDQNIMHIGFITPEYVMPSHLDGGLANYVRKVGLALEKRNHRVSIFVLSTRNAKRRDGSIELMEIERYKSPIWIRPTGFQFFISQIISSKRVKAAVFRRHRQTPIDVLQTTSYQAPGYALRQNNEIPLVCRVSSYTPLLRSAQKRQRAFGEYLSDWLEIRQVLDADAAFVPSHFIADIFKRIEGKALNVLRTPLDPVNLRTDPSYYQEKFANLKYLLYFGSLNRIKGVDLFARVLPPIFNQYEELAFIFIGRNEKATHSQTMFDYIKSHCKGFEDRLYYCSTIPKSQLYPIITGAYGAVFPSRVDNYPNSCLETLSLGIPIVGTYSSSLEEMIIDGETGFLSQNDNPTSLKDAIDRLLNQSPEERERMQVHIRDNIDAIRQEDRISQLISFYENAIENYLSKQQSIQ